MAQDQQKPRGSYDLTMRYLAQHYPRDFASFCLGKTVESAEILSPDLPSIEQRADSCYQVKVDGEVIVLHKEFQTRYIEKKFLTMLAYWASARQLYDLPVVTVVVYLTAKGYPGPGNHLFEDWVLGEQQVWYRTREIRLWELKAADILAFGSDGLIPLAVLAKGKTVEDPLRLAVEAASSIEDNAEQADMMACIALLGNLIYSRETIFSLIRSDIMKESAIAQELIEEGLEKGLEKGREEGLEKGREEGLEKGLLIGRIQSLEEILDRPITSNTQLAAMELTALKAMSENLMQEVRKNNGSGS